MGGNIMSNKILNDPEFSEIINQSEEEVERSKEQIYLNIVSSIRKELRKLNDDDCYEVTSKLKDFFIWCQR